VRFTVTMTDLDVAATRFILEIDGQRFDVGHGSPRKNPVRWPGASTGEAIATFEDRSGAWPPVRFEGPWAWFRLIEAGRPQSESDLRTILTFQNSGHQVHVAVEATTILNPFTTRDWQRFSCGS
jgi:type VI secretion system protein ImpL